MSNENKYAKLSELCEFINGDRGKNYPSGDDFIRNGIPFINAGHIQNNKIDFLNMNYISNEKFNKLGSGKVKKGDILFCLRGSLGKHAVIDVDLGAIASSLVIIRPIENRVCTNYLVHYLDSKDILEQIQKANNGSSQPNLSATSVKEFKVFLPNYEMQVKISKALDKAQELIDKRKAQIEALDELIKSVFYDMFKIFIFDSKNYKPMDMISSFIDYRGKTPEKTNYGIKLITAKNIGFGYYKEEPKEYVSEELYKRTMTRGFPKNNDILFVTEGATLGNVARIPRDYEAFAVGQRLITIACKGGIKAEYLEKYMTTQYFQKDIEKKATGSSAKGIRSSELKDIHIPIPPLDLQNKFAQIVESIEKQKDLLQQSLAQLEDNFNSLMQRAFKGELFNE